MSEILLILEIYRLSRFIFEYLKYWKVSELRLFLFYYGIFVFYGILLDNYFYYYVIFVYVIYICFKELIFLEDLKKVELMLFSFCEDFSLFYDERFIIFNVY